ncbi:succinylglutamate desuccinylase/aspartoacylase family protein [Alcanivorax sp. JB21]|uniref:succinylglutamate desuccinylase/aspartoacylase family protein n=1 Tax=Alcanivorax limicola TaxID=2874102 RepID=UPI001CC0EC4A|nr:succinylglutamate desuccinylase/aspartoacylase family protein [Alcanivorax limicola]MBZ2189589.1 succinylglutamate desuccinylase/aspartoacylase family protein [Alcanivorax limicola]
MTGPTSSTPCSKTGWLLATSLLLACVAQPLQATELEDEDLPQPDQVHILPVSPSPAAEEAGDATAVPHEDGSPVPFHLLGGEVKPGAINTLYWSPEQSFASIATPVPVLVAHGARPGPIVCMTAAVHGDELNGIEMVRRVMYQLEPEKLSGTVVGVPIVNLDGFRRGERYLADRRDLNRYFPGNPQGSSAARIAYSLFAEIVSHCQFLADLHTGSLRRVNLTQLRGDMTDPNIVEFARKFGGITVLHSAAPTGTLRRAASDAGIPTVTMEAGGPNRLEESAVDSGVQAIETMLDNLGMRKARRFWGTPQPVFYESRWLRANQGGILMSKVKLDENVRRGQVLGTVTDPITNTGSAIIAPFAGRVLGMAENQVVHTGFAAYHIGIEKAPEEVQEEAREEAREKETREPAAPSEPARQEPDAPVVEEDDAEEHRNE